VIGVPLSLGAVQETTADPFPCVAVTPVGLPGFPTRVIGVEAADGRLVISVPVARTVKVYGVPYLRPVTAHEGVDGDSGEQCLVVGELVTV
jgi:hypothetical protein